MSSPEMLQERPEKYLGPTKTRETVLIPIDDLIDPPWNPRDIEDEGEMEKLVAFMSAGGDIPPLMVWKGEGGAPWNVISGKRRRKAARILGWTQIEVILQNISLEEAMAQAIASNRDSKPFWLDEAIAIENLRDRTNWPRTMMAGKLGYSDSLIGQRLMLAGVLHQGSRDLIKRCIRGQGSPENTVEFHGVENSTAISGGGAKKGLTAVKKAKPWQLTEDAAEPLMGFLDNRNKEEAKALAFQALSVLIPGQYTRAQVEELVQHMNDGKDLAQFQPPARVKRGRPAASKPQVEGQALDGSIPRTASTPAQAEPSVEQVAPLAKGDNDSGKLVSAGPSMFLEWLAGMTLHKQIQQKIKAGQTLAGWEVFFLILYKTGEALAGVSAWVWKHAAKPALKILWGIAKGVFRGVWGILKRPLKGVGKGFGGILEWVFEKAVWLLAIGFVVWLGWDWGVNHVNPGQSMKNLAAWPIRKVESIFKHPGKAIEPPSSPSKEIGVEKAEAVPVVAQVPRTITEKPAPKAALKAPGPKKVAVVKEAKDPARQAPAPVEVTVPENLKARVEMDSHKALQFTGYLYGTTWRAMQDWQDYFHDALAEDYSANFYHEFFPPIRIEEIEQKKLTQYFRVAGEPRLLRVDRLSDDFWVTGTVTNQRDSLSTDPVPPPKSVSLVVGVWHDGKVYKVEPR